MKKIKVDAMGDQCPIPVIKTKKALKEITETTLVEVHVDNEIAVQNLSKMAKQKNLEYKCEKLEEQHYIIKIKAEAEGVSIQQKAPAENDKEICYPDRKSNTVVVLSSNQMGNGSEELKKKTKYITPSNDEHAIEFIIRWIENQLKYNNIGNR